MIGQYTVHPKADQDLDDYADYLADKVGVELALRFLAAARETFSLLATQPQIGWPARLKNPLLKSLKVFRVSGFDRMLIIYRPGPDGIDIVRVLHGSRSLQALFRRRDALE